MILPLRNYQHQAVSDLRDAYRSGAHAPLLVMPTGAGKTQVFSFIAAEGASRGRRVLILVHRRELIQQASRKLASAGVDHGIIASGITATNAPIQVASVQTLVRRLESITWSPDLIVIDEAHHAAAGSWARILAHWPDAFRLGVTATPTRLDGRGLGGTFDRLVLGPSVSSLIAGAFLTPARIYAPPVLADLSSLRVQAGDYAASDAAKRIDKPAITGDAIKHYQRLANGAPAIAFCCSTEHAEHVAAAFRAGGHRAATLLGTIPTAERDQLIDGLSTRRVDVLVTVDVVSEGFDCPGAAVAILLRPTQSESLYLQQVGRVLRPSPGKSHAVILDHVGNVTRHGFPDDPRNHSLADKPRRGRSDASCPSVRQCQVCYAAFKPAPVCPCCGAISQPCRREILQREGELQELAREAVARARRRDQGQARSLQQLIQLGQQRGMKNPVAWAKHVHFARQQANGT